MKRQSVRQRIGVACGVLVVLAASILLFQHASLIFEYSDVHAQFEQSDVEISRPSERDKEANPESLTPSETLARTGQDQEQLQPCLVSLCVAC